MTKTPSNLASPTGFCYQNQEPQPHATNSKTPGLPRERTRPYEKSRSPFALISLILLITAQAPAQELENYCNDKESWAEWSELVAKHPNDEDVQTLHALRIGLCIKVERGSITFEQADDIFNRAHESVIRKRAAEQKKGKIPL